MISRTIRLTLPLLAVALFSGAAMAQDDEGGGKKIVYKARTEIDFEGVEVAGELVKPQGQLLLDRKKGNFNPLIRIRPDFKAEMEASVDEIK